MTGNLRIIGLTMLLLAAVMCNAQTQTSVSRYPAYPLISCDPYFSVWSPADKLTDTSTSHWTGKRQALTSLVRIDGKTYRLMGDEPADIPAMRQIDVQVLPTRTIYSFNQDNVSVVLMFIQPALPDDITWMSSPVVAIVWAFKSLNGASRDVQVYFDGTAELAVNEPSQQVEFFAEQMGPLSVLRTGTTDQRVLGRKGDDLRIDWGYFYMAGDKSGIKQAVITDAQQGRQAFSQGAELSAAATSAVSVDKAPVMAMVSAPMKVTHAAEFTAYVAYDDIYSIVYFGQKLRPFWKRNGATISDLLQTTHKELSSLIRRCEAFDKELMNDLTSVGGQKYALIASLAYRQCIGANKIAADKNGMPLVFPKENHSNGCIATVDVFYPMAPQFLLLNPTLAKGSFIPILDYAMSDRWKFPFAPHDLGTYPFATGQVYGGGETGEENQMPVEESGNMLLLVAATCQAEGNADFAARYWPLLTKWAQYLESKGLDPENQLCTDDFAGHLAHNVNLSAKAILGLAAYGKMADMLGHKDEANKYTTMARQFARQWMEMADDGDHYRLAFDKAGTWSQKYNIVWDRLLDMKIFPPSVVKKEIEYYKTVQKKYGLPLDNRSNYTKLDWIVWTATMAGNREDFITLTDPIYTFLNDTPDRSPMTDWYWTHNAKKVGFTARPVVGGVFIKMMDDAALWKKWVKKAQALTDPWAVLPKPPKVTEIVPTSEKQAFEWFYTFEKPADNWTAKDFHPETWKSGKAGFGTRGTPSAVVRTEWRTPDIWIWREIELPQAAMKNPHLKIHHDEDAEVYINGQLAFKLSGYTSSYDYIEIPAATLALLKPGKNVVAIHCHQTGGGQYIDMGICEVEIVE